MIYLLIALLILGLINIILIIKLGQNSSAKEQKESLLKIEHEVAKFDKTLNTEIRETSMESRTELSNSFKNFSDTLQQSFKDTKEELTKSLKSNEDRSTQNSKDLKSEIESKLDKIRETVETKLQRIQDENTKKLDEMRKTVDDKLESTLEKRFNESFKLISTRLDLVHQGLGEMQKLATGVGDLKKVLTNVKTRGNLGEIQLGNILEEIFSPSQFEKNSMVKSGSLERVEYAIKLPGKNENQIVLLPIDSKFPNEDFQRLQDVYERIGDLTSKEVEDASKQFEHSVKKNAKDIRDKYINPPTTTDFALMFVPTEGLYAEILRRVGLFEFLQREYRVTVVGPTNLVAFLSSLQMGFRTLAIEKRSSEVWQILGAVKKQFGDFGLILEKTKKKLLEATNVIDNAGVKSRVIERKLRNVQELPAEDATFLLGNSLDIETESEATNEENTNDPELPFSQV